MDRIALNELLSWRDRPDRKPLIIRGARQVGKTHLVETFARSQFSYLATLNFEREPLLAGLFDRPDPRDIVRLIEVQTRIPVQAGKTLLFLDEIQAAPRVLAKLRYFAEELPDLHVIAAGSLLDFAIRDPALSMPVGRVSYLHLEPMTFGEFVRAEGDTSLLEYLKAMSPGDNVPAAIEQRINGLLATYLVVGGMPAIVRSWLGSRSLMEVGRVQQDLLATIRDDLAKYPTRMSRDRLLKVFAALPAFVGRKFVASKIDREEKSAALKQAFQLMVFAKLVTPVRRSACNGIPLGAEVDDAYFKLCLLDVGLYTAMCGLDAAHVIRADELTLVNSGQLAEQFVGQELRAARPFYEEPQLYCWVREQRTANAEVDYVLQHGSEIVPIEVKAGATGHLRSLHMFVKEKHRDLGVRLGGNRPALLHERTALPGPDQLPYRLLSLPLYMAGQVRRLIASAVT